MVPAKHHRNHSQQVLPCCQVVAVHLPRYRSDSQAIPVLHSAAFSFHWLKGLVRALNNIAKMGQAASVSKDAIVQAAKTKTNYLPPLGPANPVRGDQMLGCSRWSSASVLQQQPSCNSISRIGLGCHIIQTLSLLRCMLECCEHWASVLHVQQQQQQ
jgi:hypothetical protein